MCGCANYKCADVFLLLILDFLILAFWLFSLTLFGLIINNAQFYIVKLFDAGY
jgi:hypothetical protein